MGVPICKASSIYDIITTCLNQAKIPPSTPLPKGLRVPRGSQHTEQWDQEESEWPNWAPETEHARRAPDSHCKPSARPKAETLQLGTNTVSQEVGLLSQMDHLRMEP